MNLKQKECWASFESNVRQLEDSENAINFLFILQPSSLILHISAFIHFPVR
jgi:hypothetical protein